jgi:hypothetical protein
MKTLRLNKHESAAYTTVEQRGGRWGWVVEVGA